MARVSFLLLLTISPILPPLQIGDVASLYLKYNENCGEMLVQEGLMDRDLGTQNWDSVMISFINKYYAANPVVSKSSDMDQHVDLESFLKTTAVLAVMLSEDSVLGTTNNYYMAQTGDDSGFKLVAFDYNIGPAKGTCECESSISWSISRPTCGALELNPVVGPLLLKPELHARYLGYVRDFIDQVAGASDLWEEITNHAHAIHRYVQDDFWHITGTFQVQFSTDPADWKQGVVPFLMARVEDIRQQLAAIDEGTMPRGPHQQVKEANYETCVDWHSTNAPSVSCYNDCLYDGCHKPNWHTAHQCIDEKTGTCIHGTYDLACRGIRDGDQYPGMESPRNSTGLDTFCVNPYGAFPVKASICPPPPPPDQDTYNFDAYNKVE
jgi:CotH kinase protein